MVDHERILSIMRMKGPILPNAISKEIGMDILMSGAVLSEMSANKKVKISSVKLGGSPLYYLPGQEAQLTRFADRLNEKDFRCYNRLKEEKVLRDSAVSPIERVSLRVIKDFAVPLKVRTGDGEEIFWKWFMLTNEEATVHIKRLMGIEEKRPEPPRPEPKPMPVHKPIQRPEQKVVEPKPVEKPQEQRILPAGEDVLAKVKGDGFLEQVYAYFRTNGITILELDVKRKNSDAEMVIALPSAVGPLRYTVKAKNKKRVSDGDLSSAFVTAQTTKLPLLFITTGQLTKKAEEMLDKEFLGMAVKRL